MAVRVSEVTEVPAPLGLLGWPDDGAARSLGLVQHRIDALRRWHDVAQGKSEV
jgi:hypothetical protein